MVNSSKPVSFGEPEGVTEGDWFSSHAALYEHGLHRRPGRGISGSAEKGTDSIVLSGGYVDDVDEGDVILYTGEGKQEDNELVEDQSWDSPGNAGLVLTAALGKPVRVIEGLEIRGGRRKRVTGGYKYRGLYRVADFWTDIGRAGLRICRFELRKITSGEQIPRIPASPKVEGDTDLEAQARRYITRQALSRDSAVVRQVKDMYEGMCQICSTQIVVSPSGKTYSEAAHIQALGKPHEGPDELGNVLCLCPTCHVRFDRGVLQIQDDWSVLDTIQGEVVAVLRRDEGHAIRLTYVRQHRSRWSDRLSTERA
ncbi:YDG/SRA domain-containing protein [Streptomyces sp. WMMB 322]|uniref:YDG/SRA domain-containing protein n=1 Tax=Streptomyces sp. WMMB 322 TaxID=1286821 RepID=UPI000823F28C|nr:YDG/SRA domain-containing protein [Streptomyces sp. WMMB 322]SCK39190.1 Predicted restriction endonuclease [Streptomyces sp. WMMB 322]